MSNPPGDDGAMKKRNGFCRVMLEPQLEEEASLLTPEKRRELAKQFRRWARQLEVSAYIMENDRRRAREGKPKPSLRDLPIFVLRRN